MSNKEPLDKSFSKKGPHAKEDEIKKAPKTDEGDRVAYFYCFILLGFVLLTVMQMS